MDRDIFKKGLLEYGYNLSEKEEERFVKYSRLLVEWNEKINLTSIVDPEGISIKHFLDSIVPIFKIDIKKESKMIDVGTGAGFPGIPLKIAFPELEIVLLDSLNKRINFLNQVIHSLGLEKISTIHGRAEDFGRNPEYREQFDFCVSRAVARLVSLAEFCLPFVKQGGYFVPYKSGEIKEELQEAKFALRELGGEYRKTYEYQLPNSDIERTLIQVEKTKQTPKK
jgi:16S rRNA (guanine527-N7)-methyltransferase